MTQAEQLGKFVAARRYEDLSQNEVMQLKIRVLDALGCALGALGEKPVDTIRELIAEFETAGSCRLIGGGRASPDRAAFYNSALVRYLDFNDSYLAKGETCHPSDNLGAVLAASDYADASGRDFLLALAIAYQVQCRLSDEAPVRARGFDHTTQGSYAVAAGVSKALGLDAGRTAHAIAMCGSAFNALRVTRTGALSNWKGLAYPNNSFGCTHAVFLAARGITGPLQVFEGNKGFMDSIAGRFRIDWQREILDRVSRTAVKKFNAEMHSQSAIEGILELRSENSLQARDIERIDIDIFDVAFNIIGGGEEGDKKTVRLKEEADHSLPYMVAAAAIDGELTPAQYTPERIGRGDVQALLKKVFVQPDERMSGGFPGSMPCRLRVRLKSGKTLTREKKDYEGYPSRPMSWSGVVQKFTTLSAHRVKKSARENIVKAVENLDAIRVRGLLDLLEGFEDGREKITEEKT
jgi:2-methylcitrate dehydratase